MILVMKAFIFDPLWDDLITDDLKTRLQEAHIELIVIKGIAPLSDNKALHTGDEERILCVNPDYVSWKLSVDDYKSIPNLKAILGAATSVSWIDMSYASDHGIAVCDVRNFSTEAVAEWAVTMMFNVARKIPVLIKDGFPLDYDKDFVKYRGIELHGKKAGVIGLGHIGSAIAKRCKGLGMEVSYWSRSTRNSEYMYSELSKLIAECDVLFPIMELNDETKTILTDDLLRSMKSSAILISDAHGLFNQDLAIDMVKSGQLYGFGFESKPGMFNDYDGNVWAGPEYAWTTDGSMSNLITLWVENMVNASSGKFPNKVN